MNPGTQGSRKGVVAQCHQSVFLSEFGDQGLTSSNDQLMLVRTLNSTLVEFRVFLLFVAEGTHIFLFES